MKEPSPVILLSEKNGQKIGKNFSCLAQPLLSLILKGLFVSRRTPLAIDPPLSEILIRRAQALYQNRSRSHVETMEITCGALIGETQKALCPKSNFVPRPKSTY
jgi:hypothetical protein